MKVAAYIVYGVSQALYKLFGVNTPSRKAWLAIEADKLQLALIREHRIKTMVNRRTDGVYTTKEAMKIAEANDWL